MEKDDELKGIGNSYDFGERSIYDGRVSRFISIDPRSRELPYLSPYAFAGNNPIFYLDEGGENPFPFRFKMLLTKDTSYGVGMLAGIGDGIIETLDMGVTAFHMQPTNLSPQGLKAKYEAYQTTKMVFNVMTDSDLQDNIYLSLKKELGAWYTEASMNGTNAEGGYQHGKMLFLILESTIGVGELQILTKTGKFSLNASKKIAALSKLDRTLVQKNGVWKRLVDLPLQNHHLLTKYGQWGKTFNKVLKKYDLDIDDAFNKVMLHHQGPHPKEYHEDMYKRLLKIDKVAKGDKEKFLKEFNKEIKDYVKENQEILHKTTEIIN